MKKGFLIGTMIALVGSNFSYGQKSMQLTLNLNKSGVKVSPTLYGLMTEEINHSYDGGLYGELIQNRIFKDNDKLPSDWSKLEESNDNYTIGLNHQNAINKALTVCLKVNVRQDDKNAGVYNTGFWGIPVKANTTYNGSFFAKISGTGSTLIKVSIESNDGKTIYASTEVSLNSKDWKQYKFALQTAKDISESADTRFVIHTTKAGDYYFNLVSLFPPTYHNRANGNRIDIMELLKAMNPSFLRLPGGNYLEGNMFSERFNWKNTLGDISQRPGHMAPWSYRSSDGMGLLEYLEWCEDLNMDPVLAVFAGYTLNRDYLEAGPFLQPFVNSALDETEYVTGDVTTKWGKVRAKEGHPQPFKLKYVEIGNEDGFDRSGSYDGRYAQFYKAIKSAYPQLEIISTVGGIDVMGSRQKLTIQKPDVIDEHYYRSAFQMESDAAHYDNYDRKGPKIFVGEWATREGSPTPNFNAALGDAAWMTGMERNSDIVVMSCYAPLFVNVNPGAMQWKSDLIGYNTLNSYGSPSYYAQVMFNNYKGDHVVPMTGSDIPTQMQQLSNKDLDRGIKAKELPAVFYVATKDNKTGTIYLNFVNTQSTPQQVKIDLEGANKVNKNGSLIVLKANNREETNSITDPEKIIPVKENINGLAKEFVRTFPAYSISILQIGTK